MHYNLLSLSNNGIETYVRAYIYMLYILSTIKTLVYNTNTKLYIYTPEPSLQGLPFDVYITFQICQYKNSTFNSLYMQAIQ